MEATYGHIHGAAGALDTSRLNEASTYVKWALERLPEGPARTKAYFHSAWYARWQSDPVNACLYAAKSLAHSGLDTRLTAEAAILLEWSIPPEAPQPEVLAWVAAACERLGRPDWYGLRPTGVDSWLTLLSAADKLADGAAADSVWARLAAAECHTQSGDPHGAIAQYERVIAQWPGSTESRTAGLRLAPLLSYGGRAQEAAALCRSLVSQAADPEERARAAQELARARLCLGDGRASLTGFDQIIAAAPQSPEAERAVNVIAELARDCVGDDIASTWLHGLGDTFRDTRVEATAGYELARIDTAQGLSALNAQSYLVVIQRFPGTSAAALAAAALEQGAAEIIADLTAQPAPRRAESLAGCLSDLAPYLVGLDENSLHHLHDLLLSTLTSSPQLAQQLRAGLTSLADALSAGDDRDGLALISALAGDVASRFGDTAGACAAWERAAEASPASKTGAEAALRLGAARLSRHEPDKAVAAYRIARSAVVSLSPEQRAAAMVGLGEALVVLGRTEEAAYEFTAALALAPESEAAPRAAQALAQLRASR